MFVVIGSILGLLAFLPLFFSVRFAKKIGPKSNISYASLTMLGIFASFVILFIGNLIVYFNFRDNLIVFVLSCALTLSIVAIAYGVYINISRKKFKEDKLNKKKVDDQK